MKEINKKYAEINDLKALLASTDYQVIKEAEGGYSVPQEIIYERQDARARINALQYEISQADFDEIQGHLNGENELQDT